MALRKINGGVFTAIGGTGLADARVYVKIGSTFIKVGYSGDGGAYSDTHLQPGTYDLICDRMGDSAGIQNSYTHSCSRPGLN